MRRTQRARRARRARRAGPASAPPRGNAGRGRWRPSSRLPARAVSGARAIVHCATDPRREVKVLSRLVEAAREAGVHHLVYLSIVGVDRIPFPYYKAKFAAERLLERSGVPWTIQRATQFHDLVASLTTAQRRLPGVVAPAGFRFQPVEVTEVAHRLAAAVRGEAAGRVPDMGGPRVHTAHELAELTLRSAGRTCRVRDLPLPGRTARAFRQGHNLAPDLATGTVTFAEFLAAREARGGRGGSTQADRAPAPSRPSKVARASCKGTGDPL
ncbi:SDR family oxidoreductase [Streptomyces qinglanensis]|uniref:SDR family oxidoreductase n=1 Tax=Streptomyces qinglanensis TaxID=943816 RepID=UPI003D749C3F